MALPTQCPTCGAPWTPEEAARALRTVEIQERLGIRRSYLDDTPDPLVERLRKGQGRNGQTT